MKYFALFVLAVSFSSFADTKLVCKGINGSEGYVLTIQNKSPDNVPEMFPVDYKVILRKENTVYFADLVTGRQQDVQLFLRGRRGSPVLSGTAFLDELYDVNLSINGKDFNFNCEAE